MKIRFLKIIVNYLFSLKILSIFYLDKLNLQIMKTCAKCKKTLEESFFQKQDKILKTCSICRDKNKENKKIWREKNKKRISAYNKVYNSKDKEVITILMRKKGTLLFKSLFINRRSLEYESLKLLFLYQLLFTIISAFILFFKAKA